MNGSTILLGGLGLMDFCPLLVYYAISLIKIKVLRGKKIIYYGERGEKKYFIPFLPIFERLKDGVKREINGKSVTFFSL